MARLIQATGKNRKDRPRPKQNKTDRRELTMNQNSTNTNQTPKEFFSNHAGANSLANLHGTKIPHSLRGKESSEDSTEKKG